jgi:hypothetical protein
MGSVTCSETLERKALISERIWNSDLHEDRSFGVQSRCRRDRSVLSRPLEDGFDRPSPTPAPIVLLHHSFVDPSVAIVKVPPSERHRIDRRRLVEILGHGDEIRRVLIEVVRRDEALVRYL